MSPTLDEASGPSHAIKVEPMSSTGAMVINFAYVLRISHYCVL